MITTLSIEDYCMGCPCIVPEVTVLSSINDNDVYIKCGNEGRCKVLTEYLERKIKDEQQKKTTGTWR